MLVLENLCKTLPGSPPRHLLAGVNLTLEAGTWVGIRGESGVGKSTLLNLIAGLDRPDSGRLELDGVDLTRLDETAAARLRRRSMGFVFQAFHILPHLSALQNVELCLLLNAVPTVERRARAAEMLAAVGLDGRAAARPSQLSGGELQRIAIARALAHRPRLLLADEPTGNLDADTAAAVLQLLGTQIRAQPALGIMVTHSRQACAQCDRVYVLTRAGRLEAA
ncbi:MAG: ABC transporter ATP-binding protein [Rhodocyclaceae bacterium]|nr:ABC transporter ATP-binding protein [Rhodocyclaceae bacterium]MBX3669867.1 ABC transporter ATP-binding protein [Rhodocyclaceae bacterium]